MSRAGYRLLVVLVCIAATPGCGRSKNSGGKTTTRTDAGADADAGATWGASDCASCVDSSCSSEIQSCSQDPSCGAYLDCLRSCPVGTNGDVDPSCEAACPKASGTAGQSAMKALDDCRQTGAGASCSACGGTSDAGDGGNEGGDAGCARPMLCEQCAASDGGTACFKCEDEHCCQEEAACQNDPNCLPYQQCIQNCPDSYGACVASCNAQFPDGGYHNFAVKIACVTVNCLTECFTPYSACDQCGNAHCTNEYIDCEENKACSLASACITTCANSQKCHDDCVAQNPGAEPELDAYTSCLRTNCPTECN